MSKTWKKGLAYVILLGVVLDDLSVNLAVFCNV